MTKSIKKINDFNIVVARNVVNNSNTKPERWKVAWVQKNTYKKFRRPDGTFDKKENWQLI